MRVFSYLQLQLALVLTLSLSIFGTAMAQNIFPDTGRVGIGTHAPVPILHVKSLKELMRLESTNPYNITTLFNDKGQIGYFGVYNEVFDMDFGTSARNTRGSVHLVTGAKPKLSVLPNGNVGTGTTNPARRFHVFDQGGLMRLESSTGDGWLEFFNSSGYQGYIGTYNGDNDIDVGTGAGNAEGKLNLVTNASPKLSVLGNGNVGIGTTDPSRKLHVVSQGGISRFESTTKNGWLEFFNQSGYKGYIGTYNGENDLDVGTGAGNFIGKLHLVTAASPKMTILGNGNVGVGTTNPIADFHVDGDVFVNSSKGGIEYGYPGGDRFRFSTIGGGENLQLRSISDGGANKMVAYFQQNGAVGINTSNIPNAYKLAVDGRIICEELKVQLSSNWPDYVFSSDYQLPSLTEVEASIKENGHLPGIPSAASLEAQGGVEVGEMQRLMMEKIEELTLYVIDLKKENEQLKTQMTALEKAQK